MDHAEIIRAQWLLGMGIPKDRYHTYDWEEHPDSYDGPCACRCCRSYAAEEADEENLVTGGLV